jgi:two-component system, chemotaxis family, protein-glutamate methylesterase/glutaminase
VSAAERKGLKRDIVVIGGSSGALRALEFVGHLPPAFPAALFIVLHTAPTGPSLLPNIIGGYSKIPVEHADDGEAIMPGRIYVARPDHHLSIRDGFMQVARGPRENRHRPSIDVLFRSAAVAYGPRVIGVLLSGMLDDGSAGLVALRTRGGLSVVQDPADALFPEMPSNALAQAGADHCVPQSQLADILVKAVTENLAEPTFEHGPERRQQQVGEVSMKQNDYDDKPGTSSDFSCPDCGGVLRQIEDGEMLRFRCRVGHAFSGESLRAAQSDKLEEALWTALRALEEKTELARKMTDYSLSRNLKSAAPKFAEEAKKLEAHAEVIRELLKHTEGGEIS